VVVPFFRQWAFRDFGVKFHNIIVKVIDSSGAFITQEFTLVVFNNNKVDKWNIKGTDLNIAPSDGNYEDMSSVSIYDIMNFTKSVSGGSLLYFKLQKDNNFIIEDDRINWSDLGMVIDDEGNLNILAEVFDNILTYDNSGELKKVSVLKRDKGISKGKRRLSIARGLEYYYMLHLENKSFDRIENQPVNTEDIKVLDNIDISEFVISLS